MSDPSNAELVRRLDELVRSIERLTTTMENTYATKESVKRVEDLHASRLRELEKDNENRAGRERQIIASVVVGAVLLLIPLIGQIQNIVGGVQ